MSGPPGVMGHFFLPGLTRMIVLLFASASIVCLDGNPTTGVNYNLHCVNDYLFTINCSLAIPPSQNYSYWLNIIETYEREKFVCMLTNTNGDYFCSVKKSNQMPNDEDYVETFVDTDSFEIWLCHNHDGSDICKLLEDEFEVMSNITPNAPCCLNVSHSSSQHHFTWRSTYEEYNLVPGLGDSLKYELQYYKRGDKDKVKSHSIFNTNNLTYSVDDEKFAPGTVYATRVRTSPQQVFYKGQWSDWSPVVYWETAVNDLTSSNTFVSGLGKGLIPLFVLLPFALIFCYLPVKMWKQSTFIPTPAPYFHTLYSDCQGDFKSWVDTQENTAAVPKVEETLQIDTLTKFVVVEKDESQPQFQFHYQVMEGSAYSNITDPGCDASLLGMPYAVSTMTPPADPGSSLTLNSQACNHAEGDSGCWMERDPPWYCNEYCTLSAFQLSGPVTAEHHGEPPTKSCPTGTTRVEAITEVCVVTGQ